MLAIGRNVEARQLLALLAGKNDGDLRQSCNRRRLDAGDLPRQIGLIAKLLMQEGIDRRF